MSLNKSAAGKAAATTTEAPCASDFSLELCHVEVDANEESLLALEKALETLNQGPIFRDMVQEDPRAITNSVKEAGFQIAVLMQSLYTAGGNVFWVDLRRLG